MCGWCNTRTLILKPFLLQEILNVLIDWLRLYVRRCSTLYAVPLALTHATVGLERRYLMIGLGHRSAPSLLIVFVLFYALLYCEIMVSQHSTCVPSLALARIGPH